MWAGHSESNMWFPWGLYFVLPTFYSKANTHAHSVNWITGLPEPLKLSQTNLNHLIFHHLDVASTLLGASRGTKLTIRPRLLHSAISRECLSRTVLLDCLETIQLTRGGTRNFLKTSQSLQEDTTKNFRWGSIDLETFVNWRVILGKKIFPIITGN